MAVLKQGFVEFKSLKPALRFTCHLGSTPPKIIQGYGGWQEIDRPKRTSMTIWMGRAPYKMQVHILMDGFGGLNATKKAWDPTSIEPKIRILEKMATPVSKGKPPPVIRLKGPLPHSDLAWVIDTNGIDWAEDAVYVKNQRVRQSAMITVMQYVAVDIAGVTSAASDARATGGAKPDGTKKDAPTSPFTGVNDKVVVAKQGDNLLTVSVAATGDASNWHDIADLNDIRDPYTLQPGQVLRIP